MILLTNDDGYDALGFQSLYRVLSKNFEVFAVAPRTQQSGASHSLTLRRPIRVEQVRDRFYTIDGTPTDCVLLAYHDLIKTPIDIVVAGINHGPNMGSDVFYSGTVAAALQGASLGITSMAVSLTGAEYTDFTKAADYAQALITQVIAMGRDRLVLNVNIPENRDKVIRNSEQKNVMYSVIDGTLAYTIAADTDFKAIEEHYVSITPLILDLTDYEGMKGLYEYLKKSAASR
jgi:5'-nucleotidase